MPMPERPDDQPEWKTADRISDRIVDIINDEIRQPGFSPVQIFVGQMLAMVAFLRTAEGLARPFPMARVEMAIRECLRSMINEREN